MDNLVGNFREFLPVLYVLDYHEGNPSGEYLLYVEGALLYNDETVSPIVSPHLLLPHESIGSNLGISTVARMTFTYDMRCRLTSNRQVGREKCLRGSSDSFDWLD